MESSPLSSAVSMREDGERGSLNDLLSVLKSGRWVILLGALLGCGIGILHSLIAVRQYRAEITVAYVDDRESMSGLAGLASQFGGLASLAGLNVGDTNSARSEALGILQSQQLAGDFITQRGLLPKLFAGRWDANRNVWIPTWHSSRAPSVSDGIKAFQRDVRKIVVDPKSGLISLSITWKDPEEAAQWANSLIQEANARLRERAIMESQNRIDYLQKEIQRSGLVELHESLNRLIEVEIRSISIARARGDFAFRIVDPARPPDADDYVSPQMLAEIVMGLVGGAGIAAVLLVARARIRRRVLS